MSSLCQRPHVALFQVETTPPLNQQIGALTLPEAVFCKVQKMYKYTVSYILHQKENIPNPLHFASKGGLSKSVTLHFASKRRPTKSVPVCMQGRTYQICSFCFKGRTYQICYFLHQREDLPNLLHFVSKGGLTKSVTICIKGRP
jgi:hypothetical protein